MLQSMTFLINVCFKLEKIRSQDKKVYLICFLVLNIFKLNEIEKYF